MRVLITGANGFVGRAVCARLRTLGHDVVAAVRTAEKAREFLGGDSVVVGDIGPATIWASALAGVDAVCHLAARVHVMGNGHEEARARYTRVNLEGTRALAEAAGRAGVRRMVVASTIKVLGEDTEGRGPFTEEDPPAPKDAYAESKLAAEKALFAATAGAGFEAVVVRPPLVYGEGVRANFRALLRLCRLAPPLPLASVDNRRSLLYVGNLADALAACLIHPRAAGQIFLIRDGEDISTPDLIRRLGARLGRRPLLFPCPPTLLRGAARVIGKGDAAARLLDTLSVDDRKIRRELDWQPPFTLDDGLAGTVAWFTAESAPSGSRSNA